uniref:Uncharacterized protein orf62a n=1 Tax=Chara vulgaris TaxID=55564 RepID=Q1ACN7_CHAVU|nr:hypothetical protein ChvuCp007 [Chara vulgaris]ABA61987.1 hypothetical protein [Chara vulgaris]
MMCHFIHTTLCPKKYKFNKIFISITIIDINIYTYKNILYILLYILIYKYSNKKVNSITNHIQ